MPLIVGGSLAAANLVKSLTFDKAKERRERALAAATQKFSPWTGLKADKVQEADPFAAALSGAATGAQLGQGIQNAGAQKDLIKAQTDWLKGGGSPYLGNAVSGGSPYGKLSAMDYNQAPGNFWGVGNT